MSKFPVTKPYASGSETVTVEFGVPYKNNAGSTTEWSELYSKYFAITEYFYKNYYSLLKDLPEKVESDFLCAIEKSKDLNTLKTFLSPRGSALAGCTNAPYTTTLQNSEKIKKLKKHALSLITGYADKFATLFLHPAVDIDIHPTLSGVVDVNNSIVQATLKQRPIYSIADGRVLYAESAGAAWSGIVFMEHVVKCKNKNKELYFYASYNHMYPGSISNLKVGSFYKKNTKLGFLGLGSTSTGIHLHFEIRAKPDYSQVTSLQNNTLTTEFTKEIPEIGAWGSIGNVKFNMLEFIKSVHKTFPINTLTQQQFADLYTNINTNEKIAKFIINTDGDKFSAIKNFLLFKEFKSSQNASNILDGYKDPYPTLQELNFEVTGERKLPFALE